MCIYNPVSKILSEICTRLRNRTKENRIRGQEEKVYLTLHHHNNHILGLHEASYMCWPIYTVLKAARGFGTVSCLARERKLRSTEMEFCALCSFSLCCTASLVNHLLRVKFWVSPQHQHLVILKAPLKDNHLWKKIALFSIAKFHLSLKIHVSLQKPLKC